MKIQITSDFESRDYAELAVRYARLRGTHIIAFEISYRKRADTTHGFWFYAFSPPIVALESRHKIIPELTCTLTLTIFSSDLKTAQRVLLNMHGTRIKTHPYMFNPLFRK